MKFFYPKRLVPLALLVLCFGATLAQDTAYNAYRQIVTKNAARLGITTADVNAAVITDAYTDPASGITYIYLQQAFRQLKVYNTIITTAFRNGSFLYASGNFVNDIETKAGSTVPAKSHLDAVRQTARHLALNEAADFVTVTDLFSREKKYVVAAAGIAKRGIEATLVWTASGDKQQVKLSWNINVDVLNSDDWWNVRVNAQTGAVIEKDNWTVHEHFDDNELTRLYELPGNRSGKIQQPLADKKNNLVDKPQTAPQLVLQSPPPNVSTATYRVVPYPVESPIHGAYSNETNPWLMAGAGNNAITYGWHFDSTATSANNYIITRGNNVFATLDRRANNTVDAARNWPDTSTTAAPSLTFIHQVNTAAQPFKDVENKKAALDNLFYWNNVIHDVMYQYGLTEVTGNFQAQNMGRGGLGNDAVNANALDSAGFNNANFGTPVDGLSPRMQMYTWRTPPTFILSAPEPSSQPARENGFTAPNKLVDVGNISGEVVWYNDDSAGTIHTGCGATVPFNALAQAGKIVMIDGLNSCSWVSRVKKAQVAGAIGVIIYYPTVITVTGTDNTITIPVISITTAVSNTIISQLNSGTTVTAVINSGIYIDGDLDNGIVVHEYGHGISNKLTGGPANSSCLGHAEQGGEGWSDYFGLMMTTDWGAANLTDGALTRPIGTYALNQTTTGTGIRAFPYSTNLSVNPLTYANMASNTAVHYIGTIWCSALWDMTWNIIQQEASITPNLYNSAGNGGNSIALNLVMTGLKLQPCGPGFLDARNAILAADSILYGYRHKCAIWNAFARRGMGYSAIQGYASLATDQTAAFDLPAGIQTDRPVPLIVRAGTQTTIIHTSVCQCAPATGFVIRDTIPAGFTYISSTPTGTINGNVLSFPATNFAALETKNFSITLQAPAIGCAIDSVINDNRETATTGGFVPTGTPANWRVSTGRAHTPASSWFAPDTTVVANAFLTSANTVAAPEKTLSILSFWHYFSTENNYDGGVVEYSTNGTTWVDAGPLFLRSGYNAMMTTGTALAGRRAFTGTNSDFNLAVLNVSSLGTTPVQFRFRTYSDLGTGGEGWFIDDITRANGCGGILKTAVYNSANARQDTLMQPVFVVPPALPLTLLWFYAGQLGSQVALDWKTVSEINVKDFMVEWSKNGTEWTTINSVNAANRNSNNYSTLHKTPVAGNNYYRIRMNDIDGKFTYSPVRIIKISAKANPLLVLVPNPVNTDVTVYFSAALKVRSVKVYNAAGSLVRQLTVGAGVQQLRINTVNLAAGMYTLETVGGERQVTRMLVQH